MPGCAITSCKNHSGRQRKKKIVTFHMFPRDERVKKQWRACCGNKKKSNEHARICSDHFTPDDYIRDLQSELLGLPPKKLLKPAAVPTLNLIAADVTVKRERKVTNNNTNDRDTENESLSINIPAPSQQDQEESRARALEIRKRALERLRTLSPKRDNYDKETNTEIIRRTTYKLTEIERLQKRVRDLEKKNLKLTFANAKLREEKKHLNMKVASNEKCIRDCVRDGYVQLNLHMNTSTGTSYNHGY